MLIFVIASNAHLSLPLVSDNIFALSNNTSTELVSSLDGSGNAMSSASPSIVGALIDEYRQVLLKERLAFLCLLGLYLLVLLFASFAVVWHELGILRWHTRHTGVSGLKSLVLGKSAPLNPRRISPLRAEEQISGRYGRALNRVQSAIAPLLRLLAGRCRRSRTAANNAQTYVTDYNQPSHKTDDEGIREKYGDSHPPSFVAFESLRSSTSFVSRSEARHDQQSKGQEVPHTGEVMPYASAPILPVLGSIDPQGASSTERKSGGPRLHESFRFSRSRQSSSNPFLTPFDGPNEPW